MTESSITRPALVGLAVLALACSTGVADKPAAPGAKEAKDTKIAARIGDQTITLDEVDAKARQSNMQAYQALYDARSNALDELIAERLLAAEAKARGKSVDELVAAEVTAKVQAVSDTDVEAYYKENEARLRGRTLEQMSGPIREFLENQSAQSARESYLDTLREKAGVKVALDPPRVDVIVAENDPAIGPATAKIQIVEYSDFQ